jgi:hypothetical protein
MVLFSFMTNLSYSGSSLIFETAAPGKREDEDLHGYSPTQKVAPPVQRGETGISAPSYTMLRNCSSAYYVIED